MYAMSVNEILNW